MSVSCRCDFLFETRAVSFTLITHRALLSDLGTLCPRQWQGVNRGMKVAKRQYAQRHDSHFINDKVSRRLWQGFHCITDYKPPPLQMRHSDPSLSDDLNSFYESYGVKNISKAQAPTAAWNDHVLQLTVVGVQKALANINPRKAGGPDNIPGRVLKDCA